VGGRGRRENRGKTKAKLGGMGGSAKVREGEGLVRGGR